MYGPLLSAHRHSCDSPSSYYVVLIFRVVREFHHQSFSGFLLSLSTWRDALGGTSAAFDMVDHQILLERLETSCGISSLPLLWIESYLSDHTQMIVSGKLSFWVSPRALCWVLFSSSYILLTFLLSFQSIRLLVISLLTTFRHMFMVLLLVNFFSPAKLDCSQMILTLGCPQIDSL